MSGKVFEYFCNLLKIGEADNFDYYFSDITRMFKVFGLDSWSVDWKKQKIVRSAISVLALFYVFEAFYILSCRYDFDFLLLVFIVAAPSAVLFIKLLMMIVHQNEFASLINLIRNDFWNFQDFDDEQGNLKKKLLQQGSRLMMFFVRFYTVQLMLSSLSYVLWPMFSLIFHSKFITPMKILLPGFENDAWGIDIGNYFFLLLYIIIFMPAIIGFDSLQPILVLQCAIQLKFLCKLIEPLKNQNEDTSHDVKKILKQVHESHIKLQAFVDETARIFSVGNFSQLLMSAFIIGFSIYAIATSPFREKVEVIMFTFAILFQLALFCYSGQHLSIKFEDFYDNLLQVCWHRFSKEDKRNFLIILNNVQQPVVIKTVFNSHLSMILFRNVSLEWFEIEIKIFTKYNRLVREHSHIT